MTYTRDWLEANPVDHTKFSAQPGNVRAHKIDLSDRLKAMFKGFVSGDVQTDEGVIQLPFNVQASDPGASASKVKVYSKDVSAKAELFCQDEDGDVIQMTEGGKTKAESLGGVYPAVAVADIVNIASLMMPVGTIYANASVSTNPATLFGFGTWVAIEGQTVVGLVAGGFFDTVGAVPEGEAEHTLTPGETALKEHTHLVPGKSGGAVGTTANFPRADTKEDNGDIATEGVVGGEANGSAHNNIQPSYVAYVWRRTA